MQLSFKNYTTVLIEAIVVGIGLVILVELLHLFTFQTPIFNY